MTQTLPIAILAGGLATRLRPLTEKIPKSLVEVHGEPFLAHQLRLLRRNGIRQATICIGHLGELIRDYAGDGSRFDMELTYSLDGPKPLGTGGALKQAAPLLGDAFFVLYGDSYLPCDYQAVQDFFERSGKLACMTVYQNGDQWDTSNVWFEGGRIVSYHKQARRVEMRHIDYGLGVLRARALDGIPPGQPCDLADVYGRLLMENQLEGYEVSERFYEIGSLAGIAELSARLEKLKMVESK